ncbi:Uncharacterised protein [Halioglobus japonicus]|nr:Uncharacterised protein [Halioglobus japonicus]
MSIASKVLEDQQLSAVSRLFSSGLIRELARKGRSSLFARLAKESSVLELTSSDDLVRNLFDAAFSLLKRKNYRHEYIYKAAITHKILLGTHSLQTAVMLNEFRACNNKADSAIFNGTSTVYEIKSERDSLSRLEQQIRSYRKVFAKVNVITGENHLDAVLSLVPKDVGVMLLSDRYQISTVRDALNLPERTSPEAIFDAIQQIEAKKILQGYGFEIPELPNTKMFKVLREKFVTLSPVEAHDGMVTVLRSTRSLLPLAELLDALPISLQTAALSTSLRKKDHDRLVEALNTPIKKAMKWK